MKGELREDKELPVRVSDRIRQLELLALSIDQNKAPATLSRPSTTGGGGGDDGANHLAKPFKLQQPVATATGANMKIIVKKPTLMPDTGARTLPLSYISVILCF